MPSAWPLEREAQKKKELKADEEAAAVAATRREREREKERESESSSRGHACNACNGKLRCACEAAGKVGMPSPWRLERKDAGSEARLERIARILQLGV